MKKIYRIYSVSDRNVITGASDNFFDNDACAIVEANLGLTRSPVMEVWQADHLIVRLEQAPNPLSNDPFGSLPAVAA